MAHIWMMPDATNASLAASYNTLPDGSGSSGLPVADDILRIHRRTRPINTGFSGLSAVDLQGCEITYQESVALTSAGNALDLQVSNTTTSADPTLSITSNGSMMEIQTTSGIDKIEARLPSGALQLKSGSIEDLRIWSGQLLIEDAADMTDIYALTPSVRAVIREATSGGISRIYVVGASVRCYRDVTQGPGLVETNGTFILLHSAVATTVDVFGGAFNAQSLHPTLPASSSVITTLNLRGGTLTPQGAWGDVLIGTLNRFGGRVIKSIGSVSIEAAVDNNFGNVPDEMENLGMGVNS